jgi:hypothetical protein
MARGGQPYQLPSRSKSDPVDPQLGPVTEPAIDPRPITLAEAGIDKHLADRARKAAAPSAAAASCSRKWRSGKAGPSAEWLG